MIYCKVESGVVVNRASFDGSIPDDWAAKGALWVASDTAQIGWTYDGSAFTAPPPPAPVPLTPDQQRVVAILANPRRQALLTAALNTDDAGIVAYINSNVTDLASARVVLANLALLVLAVIRA